MTGEQIIINNHYICSTDTKTHLYVFGNLWNFSGSIYHIPVHILSFAFLTSWRNLPSSGLPLVARRITYGIGLVALAIIGIVDAAARLVLSILALVIKPFSHHPTTFLLQAVNGLGWSVGFITKFQIENILKEKFDSKYCHN